MNDKKAMPTRNLVFFAITSMAIIFCWSYVIEPYFWPKPHQLSRKEREEIKIAVQDWITCPTTEELLKNPPPPAPPEVAKKETKPPPEPPKVPPVPLVKPELVSLGNESFYLQARMTTWGGGVDRLIVTNFPEANADGKEVYDRDANGNIIKDANGKRVFQPLHLIPSPLDLSEEDREKLPHDATLPSFLIYHYAKPNDDRPENTLGERTWQLEGPRPNPIDEVQEVRFSTELPEMGVKITKIFTLGQKQYHLGLAVKIDRLPGATPQPFVYQLAGGHGLPIEGVWYTSVYRNAIFGWLDKGGTARRYLEDANSIHFHWGSERQIRSEDKHFQYAAVVTQYFASAICIDDEQDNRDFIQYIRATAENGTQPADKPQLGDICPRVITQELTVPEGGLEHKFVLYHGPVKARLLHQMYGAKEVDSGLVNRYENKLTLRTMTDYHSSSWIGRFANFICWTDLTIATTNAMHWILGGLTRIFPSWLAIFVLTVLVRGALTPLSRRQMAKTMAFQEKTQALAPELKKLEEQYKDNPQEFQRVKMKYMMDHGVNPMSQLSGCLLMIAQWPIFIGLYYCLQENVFFRLQSFLWIPNLAAPDMLFWWTDRILYISAPSNLGSTTYLGPYFNLLPIIAVALMIVQQKLMTPPATDENQAMQQKTMKYMMIFFGFMFYKVAAGLCLYFIAGSLWALAERKLLPKPKPKKEEPDAPGKGAKRKGKGPKPSTNGKSKFREMWDKVRKEAEKKRRV